VTPGTAAGWSYPDIPPEMVAGRVADLLPEKNPTANLDATPVASNRRARRPKEETTDEEYRAMMTRLLNNYSERIDRSGTAALADAAALRDLLDLVIDAGVERCLAEPWSASWTQIGDATGLTRQGAMRRWEGFEQSRKPGGQPANLR